MKKKIVVAIPCYNEEVTIAKVVKDFRACLPESEIHVFDNCSTDGSIEQARNVGAIIHRVSSQGKGYVMRAIFDEIDADALVVVDGDDTYDAKDVNLLLEPVIDGVADMVVGNRLSSSNRHSLFKINKFGNHLITTVINFVFNRNFKDVLSGYRVFSQKFIKEVPVLTSGFEIETELTINGLESNMRIVEEPTNYLTRPTNSYSKLRPFADGWKIFIAIAMLLRDHHPLRVYGLIGSIFIAGGILIFFANYFVSISSMLFVMLGFLIVCVGLILNAINTRFKEFKQIMGRHKYGK